MIVALVSENLNLLALLNNSDNLSQLAKSFLFLGGLIGIIDLMGATRIKKWGDLLYKSIDSKKLYFSLKESFKIVFSLIKLYFKTAIWNSLLFIFFKKLLKLGFSIIKGDIRKFSELSGVIISEKPLHKLIFMTYRILYCVAVLTGSLFAIFVIFELFSSQEAFSVKIVGFVFFCYFHISLINVVGIAYPTIFLIAISIPIVFFIIAKTFILFFVKGIAWGLEQPQLEQSAKWTSYSLCTIGGFIEFFC